ncbi:uncharacterized protein LOC114296180 [Camellia sinensis]|uniref:uncharacterized protein LOC114296180 n=1 Tax=Camellia sinensis TaxID=4442 RepID=UPI0010361348|nr:uncharacterized protein LOC114296180 [Camellia sinensis]
MEAHGNYESIQVIIRVHRPNNAILTVAYLINHLLTQVLHKKSPLQVFSGSESMFSILPKVFGCLFCPQSCFFSCPPRDPSPPFKESHDMKGFLDLYQFVAHHQWLRTQKDALAIPEWKWKHAMIEEMKALRDDNEEILRLKKYLAIEFEIKNLGNLKYFLGIEVARSKDGIFNCQRKYVLDLLKETGMLGSKACDTLLEPNHKLSDDSGGAIVDRGELSETSG